MGDETPPRGPRGRPPDLAWSERALAELRPQWLYDDTTKRYGMGLSFDCPIHPGPAHRLEFWFLRPMDGFEADKHPRLYDYYGRGFDELTVWTARPAREQRVWADECGWSGYILDGYVFSAPLGRGL